MPAHPDVMMVFDLWPDHRIEGWSGWWCVQEAGRYQEIRVGIRDLTTLPRGARVYLAGERWQDSPPSQP